MLVARTPLASAEIQQRALRSCVFGHVMRTHTHPRCSAIAMSIYQPFQRGALVLRNRFAMSPMTRGRATVDAVATFLPNELTAEYYAARARGDCGLIITEGVHVSNKVLVWLRARNVPAAQVSVAFAGQRLGECARHLDG